MKIVGFKLIDDTSMDTSIVNREYVKLYHQQRAQPNGSNQGFDFIFGETRTLIKQVMDILSLN